MTNIPVDSGIRARLSEDSGQPVRLLDRVLCAVNMTEFISCDGYAAFMRLNMIRLRLLAMAHQAHAMIGGLRVGPPTGEQRSDLAKAIDQLGQSVETISDFLRGPVSLGTAYRNRLAECSLRVTCVLSQDIPNLNVRRNIAARNMYVSRAIAVYVQRREVLQSLMENVVTRPSTGSSNRRAMMQPAHAGHADDAVQTVSAAYLRTRGECAFDAFVMEHIVPEIVAWLSSLRCRRDVAAMWSLSADRDALMNADELLNQAELGVRYARVFSDINPGFAYELLLDAVDGLTQTARLLA